MKTKTIVHNLIILDESGSMNSIKPTIISGFNELIQNIKGIANEFPEQENRITFLTFKGYATKFLHFNEALDSIHELDSSKYLPNGNTPLYDAMGIGIGKVRELSDSQENYNVLVTILTDGEENSSNEFNGAAIKHLVDELKAKHWTFTYIGADHDVSNFALNISIQNTMTWTRDEKGMKDMFVKEMQARVYYSKDIREQKPESKREYYNPSEDEPETKK